MSDHLNHECGLALIRLLKPLDYYKKKYGTSTYGLNLTAGADLLFLEPYLGVGWVKTSADLSYQGSTSIFDNTFTSGDQANTKLSSTHLFGGLQFSFFLIHLSAEYAYVFDTHKYTGKLSFYF